MVIAYGTILKMAIFDKGSVIGGLLQSGFLGYIFIGGFAATLDLLVFLMIYNALGINPSLATVISTSAGIVCSFFLNAFLNFKKRDMLIKRFVLFYLTGATGLVISVVIIFIVHGIFLIDANIAKILSIPIVVVVQFALNKRFSFSDNPDADLERLRTIIRPKR